MGRDGVRYVLEPFLADVPGDLRPAAADQLQHEALAGRLGRWAGFAGLRSFAGAHLEAGFVRFGEDAPVALPLAEPLTTAPRDLALLALGLAVYGALFAFIGAKFKRPLLIGLIFIFGWEQAALAFPGYLKYYTVAYYLQGLVPHAMPSNSRRRRQSSTGALARSTDPAA